ncbi:MAG: NAD(P)H-quinone oxidoreductase [Deltaproteobacteria bacterium]|nr:NAD(P)H-quinone oxidoreductase [Deltaproteobacteria bacterium]MBW2070091.1 NAD(P)H-quinone oxidoreductase [Deltaproteobacteria bacterium]
MKCAVIEKFGREVNNLVIQQRPDLEASGEFVRIRVTATSLNRADLLQRRGLYPAPVGAPQDVPGLEFVGTIDQIGERVTEWQGGERVFGVVAGGGYAEQVVSHQRLVVVVPEELDDVEAAAVPEAFMVAYDALVSQAEFRSGSVVLIHAVAGGIGTAAVQLVHLLGGKSIGTAGSDEKLAEVQALAPFTGINYRKEDFLEVVVSKFGQDSVDIVLDTIGAGYWQKNLAVLRDGGRLVLLGLLGGAKAETPLAMILSKRLRLVGSTLRARPLEEKIAVTQRFAREVLPHFKTGKLKAVVDSVYPFTELHAATLRMERNENIGKIVLRLQ